MVIADTPSTLTSANKRQCVMGLLRVQLAFMQSLRRDTIVKSFRATGIYPFDLQTIIGNCQRLVTLTEYRHIESVMADLLKVFRAKGELYDEDFNRLGSRNELERDKDHLVVYRRRVVLLAHKYYIQEAHNKLERKKQQEVDRLRQKAESCTTGRKG